MKPKWYIPRRTILRAMGTGVALPFLEAMVAPRLRKARAALDPKTNPRRFVGCWGLPCGQVAKDDPLAGLQVAPWTPEGPDGPLTAPDAGGFLDPFFGRGTPLGNALKGARFRDVHTKLMLATGLTDASFHHVMFGSFLTGQRQQCWTDDSNTSDCSLPVDVYGPSIDQIMAKHFTQNGLTEIPSLVLGGTKPDPTKNPYYYYLSWKSRTEFVDRDFDPNKVFDRLFAGAINPREDKAAAELRKKNQKSVLDAVLADATSITGRVGRQDQVKIQQYLQGVRDLETQIDRVGIPLLCATGTSPNIPADQLGNDYKNLDVRLRAMMDLVVKAFECDRTRVATVAFTDAYGSGYGYPFLNIVGQHHGMSHYISGDTAGDPIYNTPTMKAYMDKYGKWALQMFAYLMSELDDPLRTEPDGNTLLDNSVLYVSGDCGDSDKHQWSSGNVLLGGRGGRNDAGNWGIKSGRLVRFNAPWKFECIDPPCYPKDQINRVGNPIHPEGPLYSGHKTVKDLLWGMTKAVGVPDQEITGGKPTFGMASAPLDLSRDAP